ncbi:MAG: hypothetical protein NTX79_03545 [Candidatus Micrarchaeota archaeon]|nr:hypothetical protein [Candidatus Micrarchaeota archaeon]
MREQIKHPVRLSRAEQFMLVADFKKTMLKTGNAADRDERVKAYLKFCLWQRELAGALEGVEHDKGLSDAFKNWFKFGIEVENIWPSLVALEKNENKETSF